MGTNDKFCLRWNDFESNISVAFRELREEKDFFDVTLACDDSQIQAHKVILSASSPFFRKILLRGYGKHPFIFLKGVRFDFLKIIVDFIYKSEAFIALENFTNILIVG